MYLSPSEFGRAFEDIKQTSLSHSTCKLVIFSACLNIDSICGSSILTTLLKKNLISFQLIPIVGYNDLKVKFSSLDYDITNVILLGCGAMIDLESFLEVEASDYIDQNEDGTVKIRRKIYVIDGHRPWNLDNIFGSQIVHCFDEGIIDDELTKEKSAYEVLINLDSDEELDSEDDGEVEEVLTDDDEDDLNGKRTSPNSSQSRSKRRKFVNENERLIEQYYAAGTTVITSIALQIYVLLSTIGETNVDYLWLTIVGTTSLFQQYPRIYERIFPVLRDELIRLENAIKETSRTSESSHLKMEKDYSLFLLRHWNLYNAFFYSNYVNSKLLLYTNDGKKNLNKLFAKMGISLNAANQSWNYLDINLKKKLPSIFNKYLKLYDLDGLIKDGFIRNYGFKGDVSANEFVEAMTALLEFNHSVKKKPSSADKIIDDDEADENLEENDGDELIRLMQKREGQYITNFWKSFDALKNYDIMMKGLKIAKWQQKLIFDKGFEIFEKRMIKNLRVFRLVVLKDDMMMNSLNLHNETDEDLKNFNGAKFFQNPLMLSKLGNWLLECCAEIDNSNLPLIIASLDVETDTYLVCGLSPLKTKKENLGEIDIQVSTSKDDDLRINKFSLSFQKIVTTSSVAAKIDSFEGSVITIKRDDLSPFLEKLCSV